MVSRGIHKLAAPIFYGSNRFSFPWPSTAWIQLESFLATIGPTNVSHLRRIGIHAPLWYRGAKEDFIEGSLLDLTSPASRFGFTHSLARDRLLSAVKSGVHALLNAGKLKTLTIHLEHGKTADRWTGRFPAGRAPTDDQFISIADADDHVLRKKQGIKLLHKLSAMLVINNHGARPLLSLHHPLPHPPIQEDDLDHFRMRLPVVRKDAEACGWGVDELLRPCGWVSNPALG
jgi:hypothetical protein